MLINTTVSTHSNVIIIKKDEYDLLREKASLFNQVCAVQRRKNRGEFKYDFDYIDAIGSVLNDVISADVPEAMKVAKEDTDE